MAGVEEEQEQSTAPNPRADGSPKSTPSPTHSPHPSSPDTTMTTPEQSPGRANDDDDDDDDIWGTSSDHGHAGPDGPSASQTPLQHRIRREELLSDVPSLRRQHMTDGYREGLSVGKARVMQRGFDAGYPVGVEVGLRVGTVLGVLEGAVAALMTTTGKPRSSGGRTTEAAGSSSSSSSSPRTTKITSIVNSSLEGPSPSRSIVGRDEERPGAAVARGKPADAELVFVQHLYARAQTELKIAELTRALDDEKVAAIPDARVGVDGGGGEAENRHVDRDRDRVAVPVEIEAVIAKWEGIVLGGLGGDVARRKEDSQDGGG